MKELALNILDIVQNSIRAKADVISISVRESVVNDVYEIDIKDNGTGIPEETVKKVTDPFVTTRRTRKTGLGLPLLKYHAELTGGSLEIKSKPGEGTEIMARFSNSHIDRQPMGDISGVITILLASENDIDFIYHHRTDSGEYSFSSYETRNILETGNFQEAELLRDIRSIIDENLREIKASGIDFKEGIKALL
jgi:hypothetical protein